MDAVIFDFDGLMVDTEWPAYVSVVAAFEEHGVSLTLEEWQGRIGKGEDQRKPWTQILEERLGQPIDHEAVAAKRRVPKNTMTDSQPLLPGVVDVIGQANERGWALAVASSSPTDWVEPHLETRGVLHHFSTVRTRDHVQRTKPAPDVFLAASSALGVDPARAVVLEDSPAGVRAAVAAGMTVVAVPNRITAGGDFTGAVAVLDSLLELDLGRFV